MGAPSFRVLCERVGTTDACRVTIKSVGQECPTHTIYRRRNSCSKCDRVIHSPAATAPNQVTLISPNAFTSAARLPFIITRRAICRLKAPARTEIPSALPISFHSNPLKGTSPRRLNKNRNRQTVRRDPQVRGHHQAHRRKIAIQRRIHRQRCHHDHACWPPSASAYFRRHKTHARTAPAPPRTPATTKTRRNKSPSLASRQNADVRAGKPDQSAAARPPP